ncbi:DMT family transporter [Roseibium sediminicola]|uniref:DMT family transporter n=1 Tax=Roseibium sediminicola TaxID=2933272 RepID=A0ABT0GNK1_9HYPH|nr:DMT family transporter [Roseibium sp. CAU 1639]MCK7611004.1 DMT family transporter [Roseibium sp. CAU 1639]
MTSTSLKSAFLSPNAAGSVWMIAAMAAFALEDAFVKRAALHLPVSEVLLLFGAGGALLFWGLATLNRESVFNRDALSRVMQIRFCFELAGRLFYVLALALTPLSSTTAILQAAPIFVVLGAALFFGETVGWRRWTAIVIGLIGVLIVLRPAGDSFSLLSLLAVIGMLGFSGRDLASRAAPASLSTNLLGFYGFLTIIIAGALFGAWDRSPLVMPSSPSLLALAAAVGCGVFAYSALMKAMRTGEVASVTPFRYSRLLFGVLLGVVWFGETVDLQMLIGCGVIVGSGLFILWRGNKAKRIKTPRG